MKKNLNNYSKIKATFRTRPFKNPINHDIAIIKKKNEFIKRLLVQGLDTIIETEFDNNSEYNENILNKGDDYLNEYKVKLNDFKISLKNYKNYLIWDIRNQEEMNNYKIKGSINIPLFLVRLNLIPEILKKYVF